MRNSKLYVARRTGDAYKYDAIFVREKTYLVPQERRVVELMLDFTSVISVSNLAIHPCKRSRHATSKYLRLGLRHWQHLITDSHREYRSSSTRADSCVKPFDFESSHSAGQANASPGATPHCVGLSP